MFTILSKQFTKIKLPSRTKRMLLIYRLYFWSTLTIHTVITLIVAWPYILFAKIYCLLCKKKLSYLVRVGIWWYGRIFMFLTSWMIPIKATNSVISSPYLPCIITPNHQSFLDIYMLSAQRRKNLCFVVAQWPFTRLFFFAALMSLAKYIRVGTGEDSFNFIESCRKELERGSTLVCFPEGTRSRTGRLQQFNSGIFRVAVATGVTIVPMLFYNTGKVCPPGSLKMNPEPIYVELLQPLSATPGLHGRQAYQDLQNRTTEAMRAALNHTIQPGA